MGLVNNNRVSLFIGTDLFLNLIKHKWKCLNRDNNDRFILCQSFDQLLRFNLILGDSTDYTLLMFKLINSLLELAIEHCSISNHYHGVEDFLVILVMQARQLMR